MRKWNKVLSVISKLNLLLWIYLFVCIWTAGYLYYLFLNGNSFVKRSFCDAKSSRLYKNKWELIVIKRLRYCLLAILNTNAFSFLLSFIMCISKRRSWSTNQSFLFKWCNDLEKRRINCFQLNCLCWKSTKFFIVLHLNSGLFVLLS